MKITYLLSVVSHARYYKRVTALQALGAEPQILAFERNYYPGKPWPDGYQSLGFIQHGQYFRRLWLIAKAIPVVKDKIRATDVIYAFGLDTLLIVILARRWAGGKQPVR